MSFSYILTSNQNRICKFEVLFQTAPIFILFKQVTVEHSYNKMSVLVILDAKDGFLYHTHTYFIMPMK